MGTKLQNTMPLICISLNKNSIYRYIPRSSKHTNICNGWAGVFCNRSLVGVQLLQSFFGDGHGNYAPVN